MFKWLNGYRVPSVGDTINLPDGMTGTGTITSLIIPQSYGYYAVSVEEINTGINWILDTVYDTVNDVWNSRHHKQEIYPDLDGWRKDL